MKRKIVLYGTGMEGEKFYCKWHEFYEIVFCIDQRHGRTFHGLPVYDISEVQTSLGDYLVVIAGKEPFRYEMENRLKKIGLLEYKNYIFSECIGRKLAILYGNCHMVVLEKYLCSNPKFSDEYYIKIFLVNYKKYPSENDLQHCSLLIGEDIRADGGHVSIYDLKSCVSQECISIIIPNLFGTNIYFPQSVSKQGEEEQKKLIMKHFAKNAIDYDKVDPTQMTAVRNMGCDDYNINFVFCNLPVDEIENKIEEEDLYEKDFIVEKFNQAIQKLKDREEKCDIIISDYILEHYQERQLFYDPRHPVEDVVCEKGRRILRLLGIEVIEYDRIGRMIDEEEMFIYGCVKRALKLNFEQKYIRVSKNNTRSTFQKKPLCLREWIEDCLWWNKNQDK